MLNQKTSLDSNPWIAEREQIAQQIFYHRIAKGQAQAEYMDKALDLRYVEQKGKWYPSSSAHRSVASSKSRSATRQYASVSPIRSENGMQKPSAGA